jgi:predicted  nucleic acid-binding Zn-ribbon protein
MVVKKKAVKKTIKKSVSKKKIVKKAKKVTKKIAKKTKKKSTKKGVSKKKLVKRAKKVNVNKMVSSKELKGNGVYNINLEDKTNKAFIVEKRVKNKDKMSDIARMFYAIGAIVLIVLIVWLVVYLLNM